MAAVRIDVTQARAGQRESLIVVTEGEHTERLNPGDARRLAEDLAAGADVLEQLCPPLELVTPGSRPFLNRDVCAGAGHCVRCVGTCSIAAAGGDYRSRCCSCGANLPVKAEA